MTEDPPNYEFGNEAHFEVGARVREALDEISRAAAASRRETVLAPKEEAMVGRSPIIGEHLERAAELLDEASTFLTDDLPE